MIRPEQALSILAEAVHPLEPAALPLGRAAGAFLASPVHARLPFPPRAVAAMDGYAVRVQEAPSRVLPVAFTVKAGELPPPLPPASCARIFTGAPVPEGADAVVAQEEVTVAPGGVRFPEALEPGENVRPQGEVFAPGEQLLPAGTRLGPVQRALLAAAGVSRVAVVRKPRVALVVTGNELAPGRPGAGRIVDSNTPMLAGLLRGEWVELCRKRRVGDEAGALREALEDAVAAADLVVTTGGVSVGDYDLVPQVVGGLGGKVLFHKVAMQPGKPLLAALLGKTWLLGLPGNSVSALVGYCLFVRPCLRRLAGDGQAFALPWLRLPAAAPAKNQGKRVQFRPARLVSCQGRWAVEVLAWKGSHDLAAAARATHLARLEPESAVAEGEEVAVLGIF
jgi:molybdopterin molybdotransferase